MSIDLSELQNLNPSAIIELFTLDLTSLGGDILYFHAGTNELRTNVIWQGQEYVRYPIKISGFEISTSGPESNPKLEVSNILYAVTSLAIQHQDFIGAEVRRKRTLKKYLDAANFASGNPSANPSSEYEDDIYYVNRKVSETRKIVVFELSSKLNIDGKRLPARLISQNACPWIYRGGECSYAGSNYFDKNDNSVSSADKDVCGKRLSSCKARFGENAVLPYGGFPGAGLTGY